MINPKYTPFTMCLSCYKNKCKSWLPWHKDFRFANQGEADCYKWLKKQKHIRSIKLQVTFKLYTHYPRWWNLHLGWRNDTVYIADFLYIDSKKRKWVVHDHKDGNANQTFKNKWKRMKVQYPQYEYRITTNEDLK